MKYLRIICFLPIFMGFPGLYAQADYYRQLIFQNITVNDGLAHRTAHSIVQDQQGYIWIGTNNGLNRYDGVSLKTYRWDISDSTSLPGNIIEKVFVSRKGHLWIIISPGQLCRYDAAHDRFQTIRKKDGLAIRDITEDRNGNIYLINNTGLLYKLNPEQTTLDSPGAQLQIPGNNGNLGISSIYFDQNNNLWVSTIRQGLYLFSIGENKIQYTEQLFKTHTNLRLYSEAANGGLWFSDGLRVFHLRPDTVQDSLERIFDIQSYLPDFEGVITGICEDNKGQIWVSIHGKGLLQLRRVKGEIVVRHFSGDIRTNKGLTNPHIEDIYLDRYNVLWIGTQAGVFSVHVDQKPFFQINKVPGVEESLTHNIVHAVYRDTYLWIGTIKGVTVINPENGNIYPYTHLSKNQNIKKESVISSIFKDSRGIIWIGTDYQGVFWVTDQKDPGQLNFRQIIPQNPQMRSLSQTDIRAMTEDDFGRIWIATANQGIYLLTLTPEGAYPYRVEKIADLNSKRITNLYKDPFANAIWVGSWNHGLINISLQDRDTYQIKYYQRDPDNPNSLSLNHVNPIIKSDPKTLWVGTIGGGLNKLTFTESGEPQFKQYGTSDGLTDNTIHTILADSQGHIWLGGVGLTRFDPVSEEAVHFDSRDGLQSNLFIVNAAFRDGQGYLYFGGPYGLNFFKPDDIGIEKSQPDLVLKSLSIMNQNVEVGQKLNDRVLLDKSLNQLDRITIFERENDLSIHFLAIHTTSPGANRLRYRLKGYLDDWVEVEQTQATVTYSNLKPGTYEFQFEGCNGDGVWTTQAKRLEISILPHWYKSRLAFVGYILLGIVLLILFRRSILIQNNLKNDLKIAEIELKKDQEIADMKVRFFNNITHELRNPLTLIHGPVEELVNQDELHEDTRRSYYYLIRQNTLKLLHLVNRLLDFRKAETEYFNLKISFGDFIPFAKEVFLSFQFMAREKGIDYYFEVESQALPIYFDQEKMETVLCNLLSNAFRYSNQGDKIKLSIKQQGKNCHISVSDTGKGMPQNEVENIFNRFYQIVRAESSSVLGTGIGLSMVKEIVELHKGKIEVETQIGKGSVFTILLPAGKEHLKKVDIVSSLKEPDMIEHYLPDQKPFIQESRQPELNQQLKKMLLVEDNVEIRTFIRSVFENQFVVDEATNGVEGLASLEKQIPDIIISDIMMDQMDGISFCHHLRDHEDYLHIPVILLTARTSHIFKVEGLDSGADAYLTKPFQAQVLKAQVNNLLKSRAALKTYFHNQITLIPHPSPPTSGEVSFINELIHLIEQKIEEQEITTETLAKAMNMSHSTLYRRVKTYTGESINSFVRSIRIKRAAKLLIESDMNISEVAWQVGFSDVNYFGKCFKKQFNMSPTAYLKSR